MTPTAGQLALEAEVAAQRTRIAELTVRRDELARQLAERIKQYDLLKEALIATTEHYETLKRQVEEVKP